MQMRKTTLLLATLLLAGCSTNSGLKAARNHHTDSVQQAENTAATTRYQHRVEVEYVDGATSFLRLVPDDGQ